MRYRGFIRTFFVAMAFAFALSAGAAVADERQPASDGHKLSVNDQRRYDYFFHEALRHEVQGRFDAAYTLLDRCLSINPEAAEAYFIQSHILSVMSKDSLALVYLEKAAQLRPDNGTYQEDLASQYIDAGQLNKAAETYEKFYAANRSRSDVLLILMRIYRVNKQYGKMLDALERFEQVEGGNEQLSLAKMNTYELMGEEDKAHAVLQDLATSHPNDLTYSVMLGNWLMQHGQPEEAASIFRHALAEDPDNVQAQTSIYDYYRQTGDSARADSMMRKVLLGANVPSDTRAQFFAIAMQENDDKGGGTAPMIVLLDSMRSVLPQDTTTAMIRVSYMIRKNFPTDTVNNALRQLLALQPTNEVARLHLIQNLWGDDWAQIERLSEAGTLYNPEETAFFYFLGLTRMYRDDNRGAVDALRKGASVAGPNENHDLLGDLYSLLGDQLHVLGNDKEAFAAYDSCLIYAPDNALALNNYAYFLAISGGDLEKAETMIAKAVKAEPENATYLDTYAWVLYLQGRYAEAKVYIDLALQNDTDSVPSPDELEHAGDIYAKNGDFTAAARFYQQAIDNGGAKAALTRKIKNVLKPKK